MRPHRDVIILRSLGSAMRNNKIKNEIRRQKMELLSYFKQHYDVKLQPKEMYDFVVKQNDYKVRYYLT